MLSLTAARSSIDEYGQLRVALVITATPSASPSIFRQDFLSPSAFLSSLPGLAAHFALENSGCGIGRSWPAFSDSPKLADGDRPRGFKDRKRKREDEINLLSGMAQGIQVSDGLSSSFY